MREYPNLRKKREGWGPVRQKQIPFGDDKQEKQRQQQKQVPFGDDKQEKQRQRQQRIPPYGMTRRKQ
jgi:hypothetical protein